MRVHPVTSQELGFAIQGWQEGEQAGMSVLGFINSLILGARRSQRPHFPKSSHRGPFPLLNRQDTPRQSTHALSNRIGATANHSPDYRPALQLTSHVPYLEQVGVLPPTNGPWSADGNDG